MHSSMVSTYFLIGFLIVFLPVWLSYEYYQKITGVAVFPTMPPMRRKIIEILKKDLETRALPTYTIVDLGSGSGQLTWRIARALPQASVIGVELSYVPWLRSILRQKLFGPKNLTYKRINFWTYDVAHADAIVVYLRGNLMERTSEKLLKELKSGTLVAANAFYLRAGWDPIETFEIRVPAKVKLFVYRQK